MELNSQAQQVLDKLGTLGGKPTETLSAAEARQQPTPADAVEALLKERGEDTSPEPVANVEEKDAGGVPIRVYTPEGDGPFPIVVYYHGGGWVIANIDVYDSSPRALANATECIVVAVKYRQGPEHPFPAAHDDAFAAYRWVVENAESLGGDAKRIAVVGESAGGNLATATCMTAREESLAMPVHQVLVYPITDHDFEKPSYVEHADAKPLNAAMMKWFFDNYAPDESQRSDPRLSPLGGDLNGLPPATVITAEFDPLRDDGREYAEKLSAAGIDVETKHYDGVMHEFFGMGAVIDDAKDAVQTAATRLREAFAAEGSKAERSVA